MKRAITLLLLAGCGLLLQAQFGGLINKAREKVDGAKNKAKPVSDRAERAVDNFSPWSANEEQEIGEATAAKMIAMFGLVDSPKLVRYVNLVGQSVAQFAPRQVPYRFGVLDSDIVGAYALPGGFIFITKTAVEGMENEAQLAGALGHEIIHVSERHLETAIRSKKNSAWAIEEAKSKTLPSTEYLRKKADAFVYDLFNMSLSQDKEEGADERGSLMAAQAGYSAGGLLEFLKTLSVVSAKPENKRAFGALLSTHPSFDVRIAHLTPVMAKSSKSGKTLEARFRGEVK
jgi:predicted Zn-dependent protease